MPDLLYGLPQELWDDLCNKAEDLLYEEKIGNHIVGLYPTGERLKGEESEPPCILCLYLDSIENLLDPLRESPTVKSYTVDLALSRVFFVEFGMWVNMMCGQPQPPPSPYLVPLSGDCIFEDQNIAPIIDLVAQYRKTKDEKLLGEISRETVSFYKVLL